MDLTVREFIDLHAIRLVLDRECYRKNHNQAELAGENLQLILYNKFKWWTIKSTYDSRYCHTLHLSSYR